MGLLTLALSNPVLALGGLALVGVGLTAAYYKVRHDGVVDGRAEVQAKWDSMEEVRRMAGRAASAKLSNDAQEIRNRNARNLAGIQSRLESAQRELLSRPDRPAAGDPAGPRCEGATGAELSRPDGRFLEGEAARAESLRSGLAACYDELDKTREIINGIKPTTDKVAP